MEWVIACDQPFEKVKRPEFITMMNYTYHTGTSLKISKHDGIKRHLMKMDNETIEDVYKLFSVWFYLSSFHNILISE